MALRFVAFAYPSRSVNGLTKQEILTQYRNWSDTLTVDKSNVQDDLYRFSKLCPLDKYAYRFIDSKEKIKLKIEIDNVMMTTVFSSKVIEEN